jgi:hypothetical protein
MNVGEQGAPKLGLLRQQPCTVRLESRFLNGLFACLGIQKATPGSIVAPAGLLFGTAEQELVIIEAFRPSPVAQPEKGAAIDECLNVAFEQFLATRNVDAELASLQLVGWYFVGATGDSAPPGDSEIEFHNRRFRRATDIVLAVTPQQHTGFSIAVYSRSCLKTSTSSGGFRSGSPRLAVEAYVTKPIEVTIRPSDDDSADRAERKNTWKRMARFAKRAPLNLTPRWLRSRISPDVSTISTTPSDQSLPVVARSVLGIEPSQSQPHGLAPDSVPNAESTRPTALPIDIGTNAGAPVRSGAGQTKLPWVAALLLVLAAGVIFASFHSRVPVALFPRSASGSAVVANPPLGVQVERHEGSLLVRWDPRSSAVQVAKEAILHVDDGPQHRTIHLESSEVANGSVLYTPSSSFVMFRLEVFDNKGSTISQSLGVGDGSNSAQGIPNLRAGALATAPVAKTTEVYAKSGARSPQIAPVPVQTGKPSNSTAIAAKQALPPKIHPATAGNAPALPVSLWVRSRPPAFTQINSDATEARNLRHSPTEKVRKPERPPSVAQSRAGLTPGSRSAGQPNRDLIASRLNEPIGRKAIETSLSTPTPKTSTQGAAVKNSVTGLASTYVPARPLKQVRPDTSTLDVSLIHTSTAVGVEVRIDDMGHVTEAHVVHGGSDESNLLTSAALVAAKQWIFRPATMNGKNVSSVHAIEFHFRPQSGQQ